MSKHHWEVHRQYDQWVPGIGGLYYNSPYTEVNFFRWKWLAKRDKRRFKLGKPAIYRVKEGPSKI
jgi:hypothetical protein